MTRALIIEDSRTQAKKLAALLTSDGFTVEVALDGESGVEACLREVPDIVLSDIVLPGIDGLEVCRRLRDNPETARVPILVLTSLAEPTEVLRALAAGATNFTSKPYRDAELLVRVRRLVRGERALIASPSGERITIDATGDAGIEILFSALEDARARNEELVASQAAVERATAAREEVIAIVAHELRTPLTSLLLRTQLARRKMDAWPKDAIDLVEMLSRSGGRMVRIIEDLLQVTALEAGTFSIKRESVDVVSIAREVVSRVNVDPTLSVQLEAPERADLECDGGRVEQVLSNLVGNAIKYSKDAREVTVRIEDEGDVVRVRVRDRGMGIPAAQLPRVFERFYRTQEGKDAAAGVGLGLYLSRKLVELHGGTISVESIERVGSTFTFTLPRPAVDAA